MMENQVEKEHGTLDGNGEAIRAYAFGRSTIILGSGVNMSQRCTP